MRKVVALLTLLLILATAAIASQESWRVRITPDDGTGRSYTSSFSVGVYPTSLDGLDAQDSVPYPGLFGDLPGTCAHIANPLPEGAYSSNIKAPTLPIPEKTWDFVVAANVNYQASVIRLNACTMSSTTLPISSYYDAASGTTCPLKYYIRMIDNKGKQDAPANGTMWELPIPTQHVGTTFPYTSYWTSPVNLPVLKLSGASNAALLAEGYRFQFVQKAVVPEPSSLLALGSGLIALGGLVRKRRA